MSGESTGVIEHPGHREDAEPCSYCNQQDAVTWSDQGRPICTECLPTGCSGDTETERERSEDRTPTKSEPADFGYGESTGVQDL